jgi:hypothetical protein
MKFSYIHTLKKKAKVQRVTQACLHTLQHEVANDG